MKNLILFTTFAILMVCTAIGYTAPINGSTNSNRDGSFAVRAAATALGGKTYGIYSQCNSSAGTGVYGYNKGTISTAYGVVGESRSPDGRAILGTNLSNNGNNVGVTGESRSPFGKGVVGSNESYSGMAIGVYGSTNSPEGYPGYFTGGQGIKIPVLESDPPNPESGTIWVNIVEEKMKVQIGDRTYSLVSEN